MIKLTDDRVEDILKYMEEDIENCLYLYGDVVRYGIDDPNMTVWYSEVDGNINTVIMKYFSGCHVYSKNLNYNLDEVVEKLKQIHVNRISSQKEIIEKIYPLLMGEYEVEYGAVFKLSKFRNMQSPVEIVKAKIEDVPQIADLLMTNEMYSSSYKRQDLIEELSDRISRNIGRSYIMREGERIIAHDGVTIETDKFAVEGLLLLHEDYKDTLYGAFLDSYMVNDLGKEGKTLYAMMLDGRRQDAFVRFGNEIVARYGKMTFKDL